MSSNRHWPSLFKVKPTEPQHQFDVPTSSNVSNQASKEEERNQEPKPRWNPKPEQIQILEGIFNSGIVNPPKEEIQRIRIQLQEYGVVGDANVFYWFQNRKSRTKQKQRQLETTTQNSKSTAASQITSSSSSDPFHQSHTYQINTTDFIHGTPNSPSPMLPPGASYLGQYEAHYRNQSKREEISTNEYINHMRAAGGGMFSQGTCLEDNGGLSCLPHRYSTFLLNDSLQQSYPFYLDQLQTLETFKLEQNFAPSSVCDSTIVHAETDVNPNCCLITIFINGIAFDVPAGPINVKTSFGENAILVYSSGKPVPVDDGGYTIHALQHGAEYYLV